MVDRYHVRPRRVIGLHHNFILLTILNLCADFANESRIGPLVRPHQIAVDIDLGTRAHAFEAQEDALAFQRLGEDMLFPIIGHAGIEAVSLLLHVVRIPGVGHGHLLPVGIPLGRHLHGIRRKRPFLKFPPVVERRHIAGFRLRCKAQQAYQPYD